MHLRCECACLTNLLVADSAEDIVSHIYIYTCMKDGGIRLG